MKLAITFAAIVAASSSVAYGEADLALDAFVEDAAGRMSVADESLNVYTEQEAARRCLAYVSGAVSSDTLTQDFVFRDNLPIELNAEQRTAFTDCLLTEEGYRIEWP